MPILDFTTFTSADFAAYYNEPGTPIRHLAGYTAYENIFNFRNGQHFKDRLETLINNLSITGQNDVLELGGSRGHRAAWALNTINGINNWEIIDLYDSPFKQVHSNLTYTIGDFNTLLADTQAYKNNSKEYIISFNTLECVPDAQLPTLISNMNRITKKAQIHIIGDNNNTDYYRSEPLSWWAQQGFEAGTRFLSSYDFQNANFENMVTA